MNPEPASNIVAPRISFLMPIYNGLEFTRESLRTLRETVDLSLHEVILIDDASTDGTAEFLTQLPPPFHVILNARRSNYATSMNRGAAQARGEILCLLNNDLVFTPNWLPPMLQIFERFPNPGMVGNVQYNPRTRKLDHLGVVFAADGTPEHFGRHFMFRPFRGCTEWRAVTAACCLIKKENFLKACGFCEEYQNGCEDIDLCLTLAKMGRWHYVANNSVVGHFVSSSEGRADFNARNKRLLLERWGDQIRNGSDARERRLVAMNYALRFLSQPWRYNGPRLWHSFVTLLKYGH